MIDLKSIHIGTLISQRVVEREIEISRICDFLKCSEQEIINMYDSKSIDVDTLLKWCKLLQYDFFRLYTQHLILYAPSASGTSLVAEKKTSDLPQFRKNIYTREIIDFVLETIASGEKSKSQVMEEYKIPKTTLYKWISKYNKTK